MFGLTYVGHRAAFIARRRVLNAPDTQKTAAFRRDRASDRGPSRARRTPSAPRARSPRRGGRDRRARRRTRSRRRAAGRSSSSAARRRAARRRARSMCSVPVLGIGGRRPRGARQALGDQRQRLAAAADAMRADHRAQPAGIAGAEPADDADVDVDAPRRTRSAGLPPTSIARRGPAAERGRDARERARPARRPGREQQRRRRACRPSGRADGSASARRARDLVVAQTSWIHAAVAQQQRGVALGELARHVARGEQAGRARRDRARRRRARRRWSRPGSCRRSSPRAVDRR